MPIVQVPDGTNTIGEVSPLLLQPAEHLQSFRYSQSSQFENSQVCIEPLLQRRRSALDLNGDPISDYEFRKNLRLRCNSNNWPKVECRYNLFIRGSGLFAKLPIRRGEIVCNYAGKLVLNEVYDEMVASADPLSIKNIEEYALGGRTHTILAHGDAVDNCPILKNSFGRLVNHSRLHSNLKAPQWVNLAPKGHKAEWHAVFQVKS